jgi:tetratricopeptide (TPR) repeat protein
LPNLFFGELPTLTPTPTNTPEPEIVELAETNTPAPTLTSTPTPTPMPSPTPLPGQVRIDGLRIINQSFNNCGPANLTQMLNYYGNPVTQADVAAYLKPNPQDRNVSPWQLSDYVNNFTDLRSSAHSGGDIDLLRRLLAAGFPVVIEKGYEPNTSTSLGWFGHYLTLFAYDDARQEFTGLDTYLGPWDSSGSVESYDNVYRNWQTFNYTFFVVYPPGQEAQIQAILGPDMLDPVTMWQNAADRARAETEAEPDNPFAWFNLGTNLTRLGERTGEQTYYQQGAAAFDRAREIGLPPRMMWYQFRPYMAYMRVGRFDDMIALADGVLASEGGRYVEETFLYKGHALAYKGDLQGARAAYRQALTVNENFYPAQWALDSLP